MRARETRIGVLVVAITTLVVHAPTVLAQVGPVAPRPGMPTSATAVRQQPPLPAGREIVAADGDRIVIPNEARVVTVSRYEGQVRVAADAARTTLVVLVDYRGDNGGPDGIVDRSFRFSLLSPFSHEGKWDGWATVDEVTRFGPLRVPFKVRGSGMSLDLVGGPVRPDAASEPGVEVFGYNGMGGGGQLLGFDDAEAAAFVNERNWSTSSTHAGAPPTSTGGMSSTVQITSDPSRPATPVPSPNQPRAAVSMTPDGALRVGGNVKVPAKVLDVPPVYPAQAAHARITGVVILELTIGADGSVVNARVLRSIPLLDQAALEAARQWKYAPTLLNGVPTPVIMTATVSVAP